MTPCLPSVEVRIGMLLDITVIAKERLATLQECAY